MQGRLLEGKYRVSRLIGEGGMGAVYQAEHTLIGRPVAVKVLHGDFAKNPEVLERFRREARAATAIRHPNIIEVTDMGMTSEGQPFLVMELLEGAPLSSMIGEGRTIPVARIADLLAQVLDALEAAHAKGIVHRDLKPDNVFVVRVGNRPEFVKLLDFGISKMTDPAAGGLSMTRTGSVMGTPNYMAPEQAMGRKDCDHRVDLWAVGVMLYEALTGRLPYQGDNYNELLTAILMTTPPAPRAVNAAIDPALERVVLRALAKDREQRYQLPAEFKNELNVAARGAGSAAVFAPAAASETPPPQPVRPATLTPGGYDSPIPEAPGAARKSPWALYAGAGAVALAGIVVALVLLSGKSSAPSSTEDGRTTPAPHAVPAAAPDAATAPILPEAARPDAGQGEASTPEAAADDDGTHAATGPDAGGDSDGDAGTDGGADAGRETAREAATPFRDARPPADRGRPPGRDVGAPARDAGAPEDGRTSLRRDYT
ncbi:MAG: serine/threonine protein kinase [Deltaproteobacteria bacterium]|nr:serine/threonine protein kinase [Deltaproteobacteria bacterium]